ncbi:MAG: DUF4160 domain-containing protein [Solirubrobacterales bacterium]|nr:DUF4160 domain-containing protein [Solirubrobacterales bacterium]
MSRIRRGGFIFVTFVGDHAPLHVHVYRDSRLVVKWDLEHHQAMEGISTRTIVRLIEMLVEEGEL